MCTVCVYEKSFQCICISIKLRQKSYTCTCSYSRREFSVWLGLVIISESEGVPIIMMSLSMFNGSLKCMSENFFQCSKC